MPAPTTTTTPTLPEAEAKRLATLTAMLALRGGHQLHRLASGEYVVIRGPHSKFCRTLDQVEQFARLVGTIR